MLTEHTLVDLGYNLQVFENDHRQGGCLCYNENHVIYLIQVDDFYSLSPVVSNLGNALLTTDWPRDFKHGCNPTGQFPGDDTSYFYWDVAKLPPEVIRFLFGHDQIQVAYQMCEHLREIKADNDELDDIITTPFAYHKIAELAHEANRLYCQALGDNSQTPWASAPDWQKQSAYQGIEAIVKNPTLTAEESHQNWMAHKLETGWVYGEEKDAALKTHPSLKPYKDLPRSEQIKDELFQTIVKTALGL